MATDSTFEELAKDLQRELALGEMLEAGTSFDGNISLMLIKLNPLELRMVPDKNHKRPHLHVDYRNERHVASYAVDSAECLAGSVKRGRHHKTVVSWIEKNRETLLLIWNGLQQGKGNDAKQIVAQLEGH